MVILFGLLLIQFAVNDFMAALFSLEFGIEKFRLPIKFSPEGWKLKYWMMDNHPAFSIYLGFFLASGMILLGSTLLPKIPAKMQVLVVGGLFASAIFVLVSSGVHSLIDMTPREFMVAQLIASLLLAVGTLQKGFYFILHRLVLNATLVALLILLVTLLIKSPVTLWIILLMLALALFLQLSTEKTLLNNLLNRKQ